MNPQYKHPRPKPDEPERPWATSPDGGPPMRGQRAYKDVGIKLEVDGTTYGFRRLGVRDTSKIYTLVEEAVTWGVHNGVLKFGTFIDVLRKGRAVDGKDTGGEAWLLALVSPLLGVRVVEDELVDYLESVIITEKGVALNKGDLSDPELFPMGALPLIISKFGQHPDLLSFFGSCGEVATSPLAQAVASYLTRRVQSMMESPPSTDGSESSPPS